MTVLNLNVCYAPQKNSRYWDTSRSVSWPELVAWAEHPADHKECGGYLLGSLQGRQRNKTSIVSRSAITLDADDAGPELIARLEALGYLALVHTTWRSTPEHPRYRIILPLRGSLLPDQYRQVTTGIMRALGPEQFDPGSAEPERFMFMPSTQDPATYQHRVIDGSVATPAELLERFGAVAPAPAAVPAPAKRDPLKLPGVPGAFNRAFDIQEAIDEFHLPYTPAGADTWHYTGADPATPAGLKVVAPGLVYSHHASDPAYDQTLSAFDLVRVHRFGALDADAPAGLTPPDLPSSAALVELIQREHPTIMADAARAAGLAPVYPKDDLEAVTAAYAPRADSTVAAAMADRLRGALVYTEAAGWRHWTGQVWAAAPEDLAARLLDAQLRLWVAEQIKAGADAKATREATAVLGAGRQKGILWMVRGHLARDEAEFDADPYALNTPTGVVNLRTGELHPHDPAQLVSKMAGVGYAPGASHPDWDKALLAVSDDAREWLQLRLGQATVGQPPSDDKLVLLTGRGSNGKTGIVTAAQQALGGYAATPPPRLLMGQSADSAPEMMQLKGARLAVVEEVPDGYLSSGRIKTMVGTGYITARNLYRPFVTWRPTHTLVLTSNHRPRVAETDEGTWRRLVRMAFRRRYVPQPSAPDELLWDEHLRDRLYLEPQQRAVLAWLVEGARRSLAAAGTGPLPRSVQADTEEWRGSDDQVLAFFNEHLVLDLHCMILSEDLYDEFSSWQQSNGAAVWGRNKVTTAFKDHSVFATVTYKVHRPSGSLVVDRHPELTTKTTHRGWRGVRFRRAGEPSSSAEDIDMEALI